MAKHVYEFSLKVGKIIKSERTKLGLSQEKLAELSEISTNSIGNIERGENSPTIEILNKIAKGMNISVADIINKENLNL